MKPFQQLTRLGRVRRMRQLANQALNAYGLTKADFRLISVAGENTLFRVYDMHAQLAIKPDPYFKQGQYLLRIYSKNQQSTDDIRLEMTWLAAIRSEANLPVPEPVPNLQGELLTQIACTGIPERRDCTLLRWIRGRFVTGNGKPHHYRAQGRIMAQLHNHSSGWQHPIGMKKRRFDWHGLFQGYVRAKIPASEAWSLLADRYARPYRKIVDEVKELMSTWGIGSDVFGLIHADCGVDANVIFENGEARVIDFDGSGFGYWIFDLAVAMEHCWDIPAYYQFREAVLEGYGEYRSLPQEQLDRLELFLAAYYVNMGLWETALMHTDPSRDQKQLCEWQDYGLKFITRYLANR